MTDKNGDDIDLEGPEGPTGYEKHQEQEEEQGISDVSEMSLMTPPTGAALLKVVVDIAGQRDELSIEKGKLYRMGDGLTWNYNGMSFDQLELKDREQLSRALRAAGYPV